MSSVAGEDGIQLGGCPVYLPFFFFSSRRRHTRFKCDWSSDVCSSDLDYPGVTKVLCEQRPPSHQGNPPRRPVVVFRTEFDNRHVPLSFLWILAPFTAKLARCPHPLICRWHRTWGILRPTSARRFPRSTFPPARDA